MTDGHAAPAPLADAAVATLEDTKAALEDAVADLATSVAEALVVVGDAPAQPSAPAQPPARAASDGRATEQADTATPLMPASAASLPTDAEALVAAPPLTLSLDVPTSSLPPRPAPGAAVAVLSWRHRGVTHDATTQLAAHRACVFCRIVANKLAARIVYEDDRFVAFHDISPCSQVHYQFIPKQHIPNIKALRADADDIALRACTACRAVGQRKGA